MTNEEIRPFRIDIQQSQLDDLADRLRRTRWADAPTRPGWQQGVPPEFLRELVDYWQHGYDWRAQEARLNSYPQLVTTIDGVEVHALHVVSPEPGALPLLLTHGWPGSVVEFLDLIGPLTDPRSHGGDPADAFTVVIPSIPGYGFSGHPTEAGWTVEQTAEVFAELMSRLGYVRFGAHGGDWGSAISRALARLDPERVLGIQLNGFSNRGATPEERAALSETEAAGLDADQARWDYDLGGYAILQSTRPQTLAYALTDSPVGQLAWIVEKFQDWTDAENSPLEAVDRDLLLTNVMLYWLTGAAGSSARLYFEQAHSDQVWGAPSPIPVPLGVSLFPGDMSHPVRHLAEAAYDVRQWVEHDRGGHFAAMEEPDLVGPDIQEFFRALR